MEDIFVKVITGSEVSQTDLDLINKYRAIRLNRNTIWDHQSNNLFHSRLFFLVYNHQINSDVYRAYNNIGLMAFGTLRPIKIYPEDGSNTKKEHEVLGIQAVASIVEGKGYGKILMHKMIEYAKDYRKTLIGFCTPNNSEFYRKCGFKIWVDGNLNFYHLKKDGTEENDTGDVLYLEFDKPFIEKAANTNLKILHYVPHW